MANFSKPPLFKKILVPYDFGSQPSANALDYAIRMAEAIADYQLDVILLHVISEIPIYPMFENIMKSKSSGQTMTLREHANEVYAAMKKYAADMLEEKTQKHLNNKDTEAQMHPASFISSTRSLNITPKVLLGNPANKIVEFAKDEHIDIIVIGNSGASGISKVRTLLGSVSRAVIEQAHCPVVVVH